MKCLRQFIKNGIFVRILDRYLSKVRLARRQHSCAWRQMARREEIFGMDQMEIMESIIGRLRN